MISRSTAMRCAALVLMPLALAGCWPTGETGFVEIRTFPSAASTPLYLDSTKLEPFKGASVVLRQPVGTLKLQADAGPGRLALICELIVKKNRITTVTVSVLERPPRCQCRDADGATSRASRSCAA